MDPEIRVKRLKSVDYAALKGKTQALKSSGAKSAEKIKDLVTLNKEGKNNNIVKQHKLIWNKEFSRLTSAHRRLTKELETLSSSALVDPDLRHTWSEFESFNRQLNKEKEEYKCRIIQPVFQMCEDLRFHVQNKKQGIPVPPNAPIANILNNMKDELDQLENYFICEEDALSKELQLETLEQITNPNTLQRLQTGIPGDIWDLSSPDEDLKVDLLQEFILLDERFQDRLDCLIESYQDVQSGCLPEGWSQSERDLFESLFDGYQNFCFTNRHLMCIDLLSRVLPDKRRDQLLQFETWLIRSRIYQGLVRALVSDWIRDRRELSNRVKVTLMDACEAIEKATIAQENMKKQREICDLLCAKVRKWHEEKASIMLEEAKLQAEAYSKAEEERRLEMERENKRRQIEREKIQSYRDKIAQHKIAELEKFTALLEERKNALAEQALRDKERIEFRECQYKEKMEELKSKELLKFEEDKEREQKLEMLRKKVRPSVEFDPGRILKDTEAWKHHSTLYDSEFPECLPLASAATQLITRSGLTEANTYSDRQLLSDPRTRAEMMLREAGLMHMNYARQAVTSLKPIQAPRKDTKLSNNDFLKQE